MLKDNSHLLRSFPESLSRSGSLATANKSESLFDQHVYNLGHEIYVPQADRGIDRVVVTRNGCRKTVQITAAGCQHHRSKNGCLLDSRAGFLELGHKLGVIEDTARNLAGESMLAVKRQADLCA